MHITRYIENKNSTIRYTQKNGTQQKNHPLMPFENNGILQKWHMTNTPPKIDKYDDTCKKWCLAKMTHLAKKMSKGYLPRAD